MQNRLRVIEVCGSPYERGYRYGTACKDEIAWVVQRHFDYLERTSERGGVPLLSKERSLSLANRNVLFAKEYAPDLVEELRGIGAGADVPFEELFCLSCFLNFYDFLSPESLKGTPFWGCTTFASRKCREGSVLVGQTYDLAPFFESAAMLLRVRSKDGPDLLMYTTAGMVGCAGLNSEGIGMVINNLIPSDSRPGVPYPFVARKVLEQRRIGDAIDCILSARRASGMNYMLADRSGEIYSVETTASDYDVLYGLEGYMGHTNHYLCERLKGYERRSLLERGHSIVRWSRTNRFLKERAGSLDSATLQDVVKDHVNSPMGICRHEGDPNRAGGYSKTVMSMIFELTRSEAWFCKGNPCENEFVAYEM